MLVFLSQSRFPLYLPCLRTDDSLSVLQGTAEAVARQVGVLPGGGAWAAGLDGPSEASVSVTGMWA